MIPQDEKQLITLDRKFFINNDKKHKEQEQG